MPRGQNALSAKIKWNIWDILSQVGVTTDPAKIDAMVNWPTPNSIKALRGSLGLTGYYRRFVKSYGVISKSLTNLLKKNPFQWCLEAYLAFQNLKKAMTTAPVLALADFDKTCVVETGACSTRMGAVLMQEGKPLAFSTRP